MKTIWTLLAVVVLGMGHGMSQVAELNVPKGTNLREFVRDNVPQRNAYVNLAPQTFAVTPSIIQTNRSAGTAFTGISLISRTNITFDGVFNQSVIDGSAAFGELLLISNCSAITIKNLKFSGKFTNDYMQAPVAGFGLWGLVMYSRSEKIRFENCIFENSQDHGVWDDASSSIVPPMSTNQIDFINCKFGPNIGSTRTNSGGGITKDGTAIVPTGATVVNCKFDTVLRGIEPYTDTSGANQVVYNFVANGCDFRNVVDFAISPAGNTNIHGAQIIDCTAINDRTFTYQGTNYGFSGVASPAVAYQLNGGRAWHLQGSTASGTFFYGVYLANTTIPVDDCAILDNEVYNIDRGDGAGYGMWLGEQANTALAAAAWRRGIVSRNKVWNTANAAIRFASGRDCVVSDNILTRGQAYGTVATSGSFLWIGTAGNTTGTLTNNYVRNNLCNDLFYGAPFGYAVENNIQNLVFENNEVLNFSAPANGGFTNRAGANLLVTGPPISTVVSWDIASTAAAGQFQTNVTLSGVTTNYAITIEPLSLAFKQGVGANFTWNGFGSNGVVYATFYNVGTLADPAAANFKVTARQIWIQGN